MFTIDIAIFGVFGDGTEILPRHAVCPASGTYSLHISLFDTMTCHGSHKFIQQILHALSPVLMYLVIMMMAEYSIMLISMLTAKTVVVV